MRVIRRKLVICPSHYTNWIQHYDGGQAHERRYFRSYARLPRGTWKPTNLCGTKPTLRQNLSGMPTMLLNPTLFDEEIRDQTSTLNMFCCRSWHGLPNQGAICTTIAPTLQEFLSNCEWMGLARLRQTIRWLGSPMSIVLFRAQLPKQTLHFT